MTDTAPDGERVARVAGALTGRRARRLLERLAARDDLTVGEALRWRPRPGGPADGFDAGSGPDEAVDWRRDGAGLPPGPWLSAEVSLEAPGCEAVIELYDRPGPAPTTEVVMTPGRGEPPARWWAAVTAALADPDAAPPDASLPVGGLATEDSPAGAAPPSASPPAGGPPATWHPWRGEDGWQGQVTAALRPHADRAGLGDPAGLGARALARAAGRGQALTLALDEAGGFRGVYRRYLHGGLFRRLTGARFFARRSRDEARVLTTLRERGAPCPEPLGWFERPAGLGTRELALLTREIPGARAAPEVFRALGRHEVRRRRRLLRRLAHAVRRFHDAGGIHPDLNARNLVFDGDDHAWVLDLDRGRAAAGPATAATRRDNLRRLARSWRKLDPGASAVSRRDALAFCRAYAGGKLRGLPPGVTGPRPRGDLGGRLYAALGLALWPVALVALPPLSALGHRLGAGWRRRLGFVGPRRWPGRPPILIHAASVGEVVATQPLVAALRRRFPDTPVVLSTLSDTGRARARELAHADAVEVFPADLPGVPGRWLDRLGPRLVFVMETELWNGFYRAVRARGVPLVTVNMRVAPNRVARYRRLGLFFEPLFQIPDLLCMQSRLDEKRALAIGAPPARTRVPGDLKYDQVLGNLTAPGRAALAPFLEGNGPRLVAGSVHPGEIDEVVAAFAELRAEFPDARLTVAPRHLGRVPAVTDALDAHGLAYARRSSGRPPVGSEVLVLDTHGELALAYESAAAAFVGGSLVEVGGHSPLEPAIFGVPVFYGPHAFNFVDMNTRLREGGGAEEVADRAALVAAWRGMLAEPETARAMGAAARGVARELTGAAEKVAGWVGGRWDCTVSPLRFKQI